TKGGLRGSELRLFQRVQQRGALPVAQARRAAVRVDTGLLEQRGDLHRAKARHRLEQRGNLRLANGLVFLGLAEHGRDRLLAVLDGGQQLRACLASLSRLGQRLGALLGGQRGQSQRGVLPTSRVYAVVRGGAATE